MTIQQPQTPQQQGPTPVLQQQFGCGQSLLIVFVIFGALFAIGIVSSSAPPPPPLLPPQRLQGVALYKGRSSFRICSRADLHRCVVRWGYRNGRREGTLISAPIPLVRSVPSCETQGALADERCSGEAAILSNDAAALQTAATCMDAYGFVYRDEARFREIDPRDEAELLRAGTMRIDCAEGHFEGSFDDTI